MKHSVKQTFVLSTTNVITRFLGMIFFIILARSMSVSDYGLFRYLLTLSTMYALVFTGVPIALTKFLGDGKADPAQKSEFLGNSMILMIALFLGLAAIIFFTTENRLMLLMFTFALLVDLGYVGFARGILDYFKLNGFKLGENAIKVVILVAVYLVYRHVDITFSVAFYSFSGLISLIILEAVRPNMNVSWRFSWDRIKTLLRYTIPVTFGAVGWTLLFAISSIYIERFYGTEQVGYFSIGMTIMQVFSFLPDAINTIIMPKTAGLRDKRKVLKPLRLAVIACVLVSVLLFVPLYIFRDFAISLVFSSKYLPAAAVIFPLTISQIFLVMHQTYGSALQGLGRPGVPSIIISITAGINLVLGYFLTKSYGIVGASTALAISAFAAWVMTIIFWGWWVKGGGLEAATAELKD